MRPYYVDLHGNSFVIHGMIWCCLRPHQRPKGWKSRRWCRSKPKCPGQMKLALTWEASCSPQRVDFGPCISLYTVEMNPSESTKLILPIDLFLTFRTKLKHQKTPCSWVHPRLLRLNGEPPSEATASWRSFPMPLMLLRQMANLFGWADGPIGPMAKCYVDHPIYRCNVS
jgi:hypothetical protein